VRRKSKEPYNLEFEGINFLVSPRRVKYARIEFKSSGLELIVPWNMDPKLVLVRNRQSILKKFVGLNRQVAASRELKILNRSSNDFGDLIEFYIEEYSRKLKVECREVKLRKMKRRWGSCRSNGVITLNRQLFCMPERLLAYIIFHELVHLRIRGHNRQFKSVVAGEFPDYRELDKELTLYGLRLLS